MCAGTLSRPHAYCKCKGGRRGAPGGGFLHALLFILWIKSQTPNLQITKKSQHGNLIGYWSFFGVWTFAIWDFQRTGYPSAVQNPPWVRAEKRRSTPRKFLYPAAQVRDVIRPGSEVPRARFTRQLRPLIRRTEQPGDGSGK